MTHRTPSHLLLLVLVPAAVALAAAPAPPATPAKPPAAIEVTLEDRTGVVAIVEVPAHIPIPLLPRPGEEITAIPPDLGDGVLYGLLRHGAPDGALSLLVHRGTDGGERVILDLNDNEDLSDDPARAWEGTYGAGADGRPVLPVLRATIGIACPNRAEPVEIDILLRRFERERAGALPIGQGLTNGILVVVNSYRQGEVRIAGSKRAVALVPTALSGPQGLFTHPGTALVIDLDGDGKLNGHPFKSRERFRLGSPFLAGKAGKEAYRAAVGGCDGRRLVLTAIDPAVVARSRRPSPGPVPGEMAPDFALATIDGDTLRLRDYRGKLVLLDFWAVWCGPCRAELPYVRRAHQRYHGRGLEIVGISLDNSAEEVRRFTAQSGMSWPQILQGRGKMTPLKEDYGIRSIPATFLVDRDGRIAATQLRGERLLETIEDLLREETRRSD